MATADAAVSTAVAPKSQRSARRPAHFVTAKNSSGHTT